MAKAASVAGLPSMPLPAPPEQPQGERRLSKELSDLLLDESK